MDLSFSEQLLRMVFSTFCGQNKFLKTFWKHCRVRTKKLHKIKLKHFFFKFLKDNYEFQIGYRSRFNPECNTERGYIDYRVTVHSTRVLSDFFFQENRYTILLTLDIWHSWKKGHTMASWITRSWHTRERLYLLYTSSFNSLT